MTVAQHSGTFEIIDLGPVYRLGFGAMRITGQGIWGEPKDREEARRSYAEPSSSVSTSSTPPTPTGPTSAS